MSVERSIAMAATRPLRILCADDNVLLGEVMLCLLVKAGYWVEYVENGEMAWERIATDLLGFDVVVTDHQMPGMTGLELAQRLLAANYNGRLIVHSSGLTTEQAACYRACGATRIVTKAAKADELLHAVAAA